MSNPKEFDLDAFVNDKVYGLLGQTYDLLAVDEDILFEVFDHLKQVLLEGEIEDEYVAIFTAISNRVAVPKDLLTLGSEWDGVLQAVVLDYHLYGT